MHWPRAILPVCFIGINRFYTYRPNLLTYFLHSQIQVRYIPNYLIAGISLIWCGHLWSMHVIVQVCSAAYMHNSYMGSSLFDCTTYYICYMHGDLGFAWCIHSRTEGIRILLSMSNSCMRPIFFRISCISVLYDLYSAVKYSMLHCFDCPVHQDTFYSSTVEPLLSGQSGT